MLQCMCTNNSVHSVTYNSIVQYMGRYYYYYIFVFYPDILEITCMNNIRYK